jgi:hypothetical protein
VESAGVYKKIFGWDFTLKRGVADKTFLKLRSMLRSAEFLAQWVVEIPMFQLL